MQHMGFMKAWHEPRSGLSDVTNVYNAASKKSATAEIVKGLPCLGGCFQPLPQVSKDDNAIRCPQACTEYVHDIFSTAQLTEKEFVVRSGFMDHHTDINTRMRSILVDWLIDVHLKYKLRPETLFLAVSILDRYLEAKHVTRRLLQLVGLGSMMIAAKYEEIYPPEVQKFIYVADNAYNKDQFLKMELDILTTLNFRICTPTVGHFLERYMDLNCADDNHRHLMQYVTELSLVSSTMSNFSPSLIAAAAALLSNKLLEKHPAWPLSMIQNTDMTEASIKVCAREMCNILETAERSNLQAVRKKFSQPKYSGVGKMSF